MMQSSENNFLDRAYALSSASDARTLYDEWAQTYDSDLEAARYASPTIAVKAIADQMKWNPPTSGATIKILDAGCGTGLVGVLLMQALDSLKHTIKIDGLDISPGMLESATKKGVYTRLEEADLSKPINAPDNEYDIVACVGTLTQGHVGASVISEFARVARQDALIVLTIMDSIYVSGGYKQVVQQLQTSGQAEILREEAIGFTKDVNEGGKLLVLRRFRA